MKVKSCLILSAVVLFVSMTVASIAFADAQSSAVISFLKGTAKVMKNGSTEWKPAALGTKLEQGDRLATGAGTQLEIKCSDGNVIRIGDNTEMMLQTIGEDEKTKEKVSSVKIMVGRVWANVAKKIGLVSKFEIHTPNAIAAVKGTVYRADVSDKDTQVNVYDGTVNLQKSDGTSLDVNAWQKAVVMPASALEKSEFDEQEDEKDSWVRWNKSRDKLRVMIIVPEKVAGEKSIVSLAETLMIKRFMRNYLFQVLDKEQVDKVRENAAKAALAGDNKGAAAAGLEVASDLVVVGEAKMAINDKALPNMISCTARIAGRVIRADTAEVLSSDFKEGRKVDITSDGAATKAAEAASNLLSDLFVSDIVKKWKKEVQKGSNIDIAVYNVEYKQINAIKTELSKITGLKDPQTLYFVAKRALLTATYVGDSVGLVEEINKMAFPDFKLEVVGLSAYKIELEVRK